MCWLFLRWFLLRPSLHPLSLPPVLLHFWAALIWSFMMFLSPRFIENKIYEFSFHFSCCSWCWEASERSHSCVPTELFWVDGSLELESIWYSACLSSDSFGFQFWFPVSQTCKLVPRPQLRWWITVVSKKCRAHNWKQNRLLWFYIYFSFMLKMFLPSDISYLLYLKGNTGSIFTKKNTAKCRLQFHGPLFLSFYIHSQRMITQNMFFFQNMF